MTRSTSPTAGLDLPVAMTIAGSDSGAGAGIQADLLTFAAIGVYGTTVITSLTAQNPDGVTAVHAATPEFVAEQIRQVVSFYRPRALKTGMLFDAGIIGAVCEFLRERRDIQSVVDPVMVATSGSRLLKEDAIARVGDELLPLATLVTPNLDETAVLLGSLPSNPQEVREAARTLSDRYKTAILLKGGHLESGELVHDILCTAAGEIVAMHHERVAGVNTHGSGCTLSAAIAANLAKGLDLVSAVDAGRRYLVRGMKDALQVSGQRFIAHL